jgi:ribonuclease HI
LKGSGAGIVLEGKGDILIEQSPIFEFKASNNQAEYEALIAGMNLTHEIGAENLRARSDSQLETSQITGEYQTKNTQLSKYLAKVNTLAGSFKFFKEIFVPREQNARADLIAKITSTKKPGNNRTVIQEVISEPITKAIDVNMTTEEEEGYMTPTLIKYLTRAFTPKNEEEEALVRRRASKFTKVVGKLYKMGKATPMLRCLGESETKLVLLEVHEGLCGSHIEGRALAAKF